MCKLVRMISTILISGALTGVAIASEIPRSINYQGRLTDPITSAPLDTIVDIEFRIYSEALVGAPLWSETSTLVSVVDGLFVVMLGATVPIPDSVFSEPATYLGITVGDNAEMSPRTLLNSVPYAYRTAFVNGSSISDSSINASKIADEPGVAQAVQWEYADTIPGTPFGIPATEIISRTIVCPAPGYVMAFAKAEIQVTHTDGFENQTAFGLSNLDNPGSFPPDQDAQWFIPPDQSPGTYTNIVSTNRIYPVSAGAHTIYLLGRDGSSSTTPIFVYRSVLSLLFVPSAYGTVAETSD